MILLNHDNTFCEYQVLEMLATKLGKCVVQLKAVGLLELEDNGVARENEVWDYYTDKTRLELLNKLINADDSSREIYVILDSEDDLIEAYETWFPQEIDLTSEERIYYIKFTGLSSDLTISLTNEDPTRTA